MQLTGNRTGMNENLKQKTSRASSPEQFVTVCAWSNTVKHDGEWMPFATYLHRRFGLLTTHGMSPRALEQLEWEEQLHEGGALTDPKRLAALRATGLLDAQPMVGFDRITRLGKAALNVPVTFISLVDEYRDFYLSQCGFGEPLATERQITGQTFCHFTIQEERPVIIPDTRADPVYARVPTVQSEGVAAYLGVPLVLSSGDIIGAFCAIDVAPHTWSEEQVLTATDLATFVLSEIELRQAALDFQRQLEAINAAGSGFRSP